MPDTRTHIMKDEFEMPTMPGMEDEAPTGASSLADLLEKIEAKFPDDEDVMAFSEEFNAEYGDEDSESDPFAEDFDDEAPAEDGAPADFGAMFSEDTAEDEEEDDEFAMPPKKKSKY